MAKYNEYEWDDEKEETNFAKHGYYLSQAIGLFDDRHALYFDVLPDARTGEPRKMIIGQIEETVLSCVYLERVDIIRLISLYPRTGRLRNEYRKNRLS